MKVLKTSIKGNNIISIAILAFIGSCSNHQNTDKVVKVDTLEIITKDTAEESFLKDCDKWNEKSSGRLMGLENKPKDSTSHLCFSAYYDGPETYEIIFTYKGGVEKGKLIGDDSISNDFFKGCKNLFVDFDCFAFVIKMRDPQKQEDMHETNYSFPAYARVYKRLIADKWTLIKRVKVNSYQEYRNLQFNTIYSLGSK